MSELINLNRYRKDRERAAAAKRGAENRTRFGRPKDERTRTRLEQEKAAKDLAGKRLDES